MEVTPDKICFFSPVNITQIITINFKEVLFFWCADYEINSARLRTRNNEAFFYGIPDKISNQL